MFDFGAVDLLGMLLGSLIYELGDINRKLII